MSAEIDRKQTRGDRERRAVIFSKWVNSLAMASVFCKRLMLMNAALWFSLRLARAVKVDARAFLQVYCSCM